MIKLINEAATGINVSYSTEDGKRGSFLLDFTDPRSFFQELESLTGYDFSHQVEHEFYNWKEQLEAVPSQLAGDCGDIIDMIDETRKNVDDLYESTESGETKSALFDILEQLDEIKETVDNTSAWADEINYILTGKGLND